MCVTPCALSSNHSLPWTFTWTPAASSSKQATNARMWSTMRGLTLRWSSDPVEKVKILRCNASLACLLLHAAFPPPKSVGQVVLMYRSVVDGKETQSLVVTQPNQNENWRQGPRTAAVAGQAGPSWAALGRRNVKQKQPQYQKPEVSEWLHRLVIQRQSWSTRSSVHDHLAASQHSLGLTGLECYQTTPRQLLQQVMSSAAHHSSTILYTSC